MAPSANNKKKKSKAAASKVIPNGKVHTNGEPHSNGVPQANGKHEVLSKTPDEASNGVGNHIIKSLTENGCLIPTSPKKIESPAPAVQAADERKLEEIVVLKEKLLRQTECVSELEREKHAHRAELEAQKQAHAAELAAKDLTHQEVRDRLEKAESSNQQLSIEKEVLHASCCKSRETIIDLQEKNAEAAFYKMRTKAAQEHLRGECARLQQELSIWRGRADMMAKEVVQYQEQLKLSEDQVVSLKDQLANTSGNEAVTAELAQAVARAELAEAAKSRCDSRIDRLRLEWQASRCALAEMEKEKDDMQCANSQLHLQVRERDVKLAQAETKLQLMAKESLEQLAQAEAKLQLKEVEMQELRVKTAAWVTPTITACAMCAAGGLFVVMRAGLSRTYTR